MQPNQYRAIYPAMGLAKRLPLRHQRHLKTQRFPTTPTVPWIAHLVEN